MSKGDIKMKRYEIMQKHYNEIINFAAKLIKEHEGYCEGWHDDVCMRKNGTLYHTGLVNYGASDEVFNGNAFEVFKVNSNEKMSIEEIKEQLDINISIAESMEVD